MLILYCKFIKNIKLCTKSFVYNKIIEGRKFSSVFDLLNSKVNTDSSSEEDSTNKMARRPNFPPGPGPRMDYNGPPPPPMMDFNCPPRLPFGNPRMDFPRPPRMDFPTYDDSFRSHRTMPFRGGSGYIDENGEFRRPHMKVHCGELREHHAGLVVEISGRVNKQRLGRFLTLKDANGMTQLVVPDSKPYLVRKVTNIPLDSYIVVNGTVNKRPKNQRNTFMSTGNVEVAINKILSVKYKSSKDAMLMSAIQTRHNSTCSNSLCLTSEEFKRCGSQSVSSQFSKRTHNCGQLCGDYENTEVTLCGWVESKQGKFLHLRDGYGMVQVVVPNNNPEINDIIKKLDIDKVIQIKGKINMRPEQQKNYTIQTGDIEVEALEIIPILPSSDEENMSVDQAEEEKVNVNSFIYRTHNCGQLREEHIGQSVTLCGWLEYHRVGKFVILRDGYGRTQLIIPDERQDIQRLIDHLSYESIIKANGVVTSRPPNSEQKSMSTGKIEVVIQDVEVLNEAKQHLPFNIREHNKAKEPLRMEHRYLDLRFSEMQQNLRLRSKMIMAMREFLINQAEFVEVETPTLFRATPGGAQEFIVPTRNKGHVYSLVQSPQQFKQILMSGAIDRYFQIARCYRDEGARPDRQPEFTQLDIELSFTTVDGVLTLIEKILKHSWPSHLPPISIPFKRITLKEAMELYGSDKPDLRIESKFVDVTDILKNNVDLIKVENFASYAIVFKKPYNGLTVALKNIYEEKCKVRPSTTLIQARLADDIDYWCTDISKKLGDTVPKMLVDKLNLEENSVMFLAFGEKKHVQSLLGEIRVEYMNHLEERGQIVRGNEGMHFVWITDFPLFEETDIPGELTSAHHPFTAPHPDDVKYLMIDPLKMRGQSYDLVLNGVEVGGGSIRIHNAQLQLDVLKKLNIKTNTMTHLINALACGCPPHGGIALGLDRLFSTILKTNSIRDVIAFPKGVDGKDPMSGAPVMITPEDKKLYQIELSRTPTKEINSNVTVNDVTEINQTNEKDANNVEKKIKEDAV